MEAEEREEKREFAPRAMSKRGREAAAQFGNERRGEAIIG